ncbi:glycosyltransferase [Roseivirga sp.]|uniref:glycosyltransferase n=1 Tax=Roseivirga sp. TaxID=1964215 RepID=UPI003B8D6F1E
MRQKDGETNEVAISVIIPFRNEELNLVQLVSSLNNQVHSQFEAIFIDDHSEDNGFEVLQSLLSEVSFQYKILRLESGTGKKEAIHLGISSSRYDLIITTDADCEMNAEWLRTMACPFKESDLQMLAGPIGLKGDSFWQRMQSMESSALIGIGGVMISNGKPTMANGANLAYRKRAYHKVNGFEGISETPSGDDELLMNKVLAIYPKGIQFCKLEKALVQTAAQPSWPLFKQQRLRWASKWKYGKRGATILIALFVLMIQLIQIGLIGMLYFNNNYMKLAIGLLGLRLLIELIFLWSVRRSLGQKTYVLPAIFSYLLYPFYAIYIGVAANFGKFEWKGRNYNINGLG